MTTWTAPDATPDELDAIRQILAGEYLPWCPDRPNVAARAIEIKKVKHRETPLFDPKEAA